MKSAKRLLGYFRCFLLGVLFILAGQQIYKFVDELIITGSEIQSQASFPRYHMAKLYSRAGIGDQTFTFKVDGKTIWVSGDAPPGDISEQIIWDESGHTVVLMLNEKKVIFYDALNQEVRY